MSVRSSHLSSFRYLCPVQQSSTIQVLHKFVTAIGGLARAFWQIDAVSGGRWKSSFVIASTISVALGEVDDEYFSINGRFLLFTVSLQI